MNPLDRAPGGRISPLTVVVTAAYREAGVEMPPQVEKALTLRQESWPWFAAQMFSLNISVETRRRLQTAFHRERQHVRVEPAEHEPTRPTADDELQAATPMGFNALLRLLHQRSGVSPAMLAKRAGRGLPRSQAYELVKDDRANLPNKLEQVRLFARACGLPERQIDLLVQLWADLRDGSSTRSSSLLERDLGRLLAKYYKIVDSHGGAGVDPPKIDFVGLGEISRGRLLVRERRQRKRRGPTA